MPSSPVVMLLIDCEDHPPPVLDLNRCLKRFPRTGGFKQSGNGERQGQQAIWGARGCAGLLWSSVLSVANCTIPYGKPSMANCTANPTRSPISCTAMTTLTFVIPINRAQTAPVDAMMTSPLPRRRRPLQSIHRVDCFVPIHPPPPTP